MAKAIQREYASIRAKRIRAAFLNGVAGHTAKAVHEQEAKRIANGAGRKL